MSEARLVLFTRPDCHLCEEAAELLRAQGLAWRAENIDRDLDLIRRYGDRIPVLRRAATGAELFWPFDLEDVRRFMA